MRRTACVAWLGGLLIACSGSGASPTAQAPAPAVPVPVPPPTRPSWLYEITTDTQPSYLFVMLEPGCPLHESFPSEYEILFRFARIVVVPVAWTEDEERALLLEHGMSASYQLDRQLGADGFTDFVDLTQMPPEMATHMFPLTGLAMIWQGLASDVYGAPRTDSRVSPTHDATARRRLSGLPVTGASTADEAREAFDRFARAPSTLAALRASIGHPADLRAELAARLSAYRAGDEADLARHLESDVLEVHAHQEAMRAEIEARRTRTLPRIEAELRAGNALVLVDADDALGDEGLLAQLGTDHFVVRRLSVAAPAE